MANVKERYRSLRHKGTKNIVFTREDIIAAAESGEKSRIKKILEVIPEYADTKNSANQTIVHLLTSSGNIETLKWFLNSKFNYDINQKDNHGFTALHHSVIDRRFEITELLLEQEKIDVNVTTQDSNTALHYFVRQKLEENSLNIERHILTLFMKKGAKIDCRNKLGETPLMQACFRGPEMSIFFLLRNGADVNACNRSRETPIHYAIRRGDIEIIKALVKTPTDDKTASKEINLSIKGIDGDAFTLAKSLKREDIYSLLCETENRKSLLLKLGHNILLNLLSFLTPIEFMKFAFVCKLFREVVNDDALWKLRFEIDFNKPAKTIEKKFSWKKEYIKFYKQNFQKMRQGTDRVSIKEAYRFKRKKYDPAKIEIIQRTIRGHLERKYFQKIYEKQKQRTNIANEILETERTYFNGLDLLIKYFYKPLQKETTKSFSSLISKSQFEAIFGDIEVIRNMSEILIKLLEEKLKNWNIHSTIGDVFSRVAGFLKMYTAFVNSATKSIYTIRECLKKNDFKKWMKTTLAIPDLQKKDLNSLLILPVQRIPRYELLLENMVKNTWESHPDYKELSKALFAVRDAAVHVNEQKRDADNFEQVNQIFSSFLRIKEEIPSYRRWIKSGPIVEIQEEIQLQKNLFLFNDILVIAQPVLGKKSFNVSSSLELINLDVEKGDSSVLNSLKVYNKAESHLLCFSSVQELEEWLEKLHYYINEAKKSDKFKPSYTIDVPLERKKDSHIVSLVHEVFGKSPQVTTSFNKEQTSPIKEKEDSIEELKHHLQVAELKMKKEMQKREEIEQFIKLHPDEDLNTLRKQHMELKTILINKLDNLHPSAVNNFLDALKAEILEDPLLCKRMDQVLKKTSNLSKRSSFVSKQSSRTLLAKSNPSLLTNESNSEAKKFNDLVSPPTPSEFIPYQTLVAHVQNQSTPPEVNRNYIENYLSDIEFQAIFQMNKKQFYSEPIWKQRSLKKKFGLF